MKLAVIGAGEMGHGVAELSALHGHDVRMRDLKTEYVDRGLERIRWSLGKLVEVIRADTTSDATLQAAVDLAKSFGKTVVVVKKDVPGFITTRILGPYFERAAWIHEKEDIPIETIDAAMRFRAGFPMGPFELADQVGVD